MSAEDSGSITRWLEGLKAGQPEAVEAIWRHYYARVIEVAQRRLRMGPRQAVEDGEDVALSALNGLFAGAAQGHFEHLEDRADLWQLLTAITIKKVLVRRKWYARWKRTDGPALRDPNSPSVPQDAELDSDPAGFLARAVSNEPAPELAAMFREQVQRLLDALTDPTLRQIAEWRMEGLTNAEIARNLGRVTRTVERKFELIRLIWDKIADEPDP